MNSTISFETDCRIVFCNQLACMSSKKKAIIVFAIISAVILIDQILKFWVKLNFTLGETVEITSWFHLHFIENNGMAFGMELFGKLFLTLFRIVASAALVYFIYKLIKNKYKLGYIICIALVLAGAVGNLIDSVFYGLIFTESEFFQLAQLVSVGDGYQSMFYGKVVDMFYFPLIHDANGQTLFFRPVFNFADASVSVSVILIMLFYRKELNHSLESSKSKSETPSED